MSPNQLVFLHFIGNTSSRSASDKCHTAAQKVLCKNWGHIPISR
jgi:hypothetical protein